MKNTLRKIVQTSFICFATGFFVLGNLQHCAFAAWSSNVRENTAICTTPGQQSTIQVISDGAGGVIIVWEDTRNIHFDIYAQRIDAHGNILWKKDGVSVCAAMENQNRPRAVSDGAGGAIITWQDMRGGISNSDVYVQRIDADGNALWTKDGIPVCMEINAQNSPCIATDGAGGAVIIWQDYRTNYADLCAQHINKNGELQWAVNGVAVCTTSGAQGAPVAVSDGSGGVIVVWQDFRRTYADIYAQRVDGSGKILWERSGVVLCNAIGHESFPVITGNGAEGAIVAWVDTRNGNNDVFAQQVDGNGAVQWLANGIPVCAVSGNQNYPVITGDGAGGAIIAWWDMRSGDFNVYAQRIDLAGKPIWTSDGLAVCVETGIQNCVSVGSDSSGNAIIAWNDNRVSAFDVYAQKIDPKGLAKWSNNGVAVSTASDTQCFPVVFNEETGGAIIVWQDGRDTDRNYWDIYVQKINSQGFPGD